jgi:hypothetical protein
VSTHPYDILALPKQGCLIFIPCPGTKGVYRTTLVSEFHLTSADAIVTMMTDEELAKFEVASLFMVAVIMRELCMGVARATDLVKGLRPNSLKLPANTGYLSAHYGASLALIATSALGVLDRVAHLSARQRAHSACHRGCRIYSDRYLDPAVRLNR